MVHVTPFTQYLADAQFRRLVKLAKKEGFELLHETMFDSSKYRTNSYYLAARLRTMFFKHETRQLVLVVNHVEHQYRDSEDLHSYWSVDLHFMPAFTSRYRDTPIFEEKYSSLYQGILKEDGGEEYVQQELITPEGWRECGSVIGGGEVKHHLEQDCTDIEQVVEMMQFYGGERLECFRLANEVKFGHFSPDICLTSVFTDIYVDFEASCREVDWSSISDKISFYHTQKFKKVEQ